MTGLTVLFTERKVPQVLVWYHSLIMMIKKEYNILTKPSVPGQNEAKVVHVYISCMCVYLNLQLRFIYTQIWVVN